MQERPPIWGTCRWETSIFRRFPSREAWLFLGNSICAEREWCWWWCAWWWEGRFSLKWCTWSDPSLQPPFHRGSRKRCVLWVIRGWGGFRRGVETLCTRSSIGNMCSNINAILKLWFWGQRCSGNYCLSTSVSRSNIKYIMYDRFFEFAYLISYIIHNLNTTRKIMKSFNKFLISHLNLWQCSPLSHLSDWFWMRW
jgi:hypothetical protein